VLKLKAHSIKTDNTGIKSKKNLREKATKNLNTIKVLDLFAGNNLLWEDIKKEKYYGIEIEKNKGKNLYADNLKVIPSLDLSYFNVIDCDSYGVPYNQIKAIFKNKTLKKGTVIIYTCITNKTSKLNKEAVKDNNIEKIYKKCQTLWNSKAIEFFYNMLYNNGIRKISCYVKKEKFDKHYGFFIV
jgi:hypothetical protein